MEAQRLKGKTAVITGAGSGIGKAISLRFAREGANIVCADIDIESARVTARGVEELGPKALAVKVDVSSAADIDALVKRVYETEWIEQVDLLCNNAGISTSASISSMSEELWDKTFAVNAKSVFLMTKAFVRKMRRNKAPKGQIRGKIINTASIRGKVGRANLSAYSASKGAVVSFTQAAARELGSRKITVNCICPGTIYTAIWGDTKPEQIANFSEPANPGMPMPGMPEDVANVAYFLASDDSNYLTGQALNCTGGMHFC